MEFYRTSFSAIYYFFYTNVIDLSLKLYEKKEKGQYNIDLCPELWHSKVCISCLNTQNNRDYIYSQKKIKAAVDTLNFN